VSEILSQAPPESAMASGAENAPLPNSGASAGALAPFPTEAVPPQPIKTVNLPFERAQMLATLPRKKWDEWTWAALGGAVAAFPSAIDAIISAYQATPVSFRIFQTIQIVIFGGFLVWFFVSRAYSKGTQTTAEYLNELYSIRPDKAAQKKWWQFWNT
jgi:hypothetical protein